jgi:hypothetical protein
MSTRSQASCLALFLAIAAICVASHSQLTDRESSASRIATVNATLPSTAPVVLYSAEQSSPQPAPEAQKAYARAPFVNVYAIYRHGVQEHVHLRSQEYRPMRSPEPADPAPGHVLLAGQKTA